MNAGSRNRVPAALAIDHQQRARHIVQGSNDQLIVAITGQDIRAPDRLRDGHRVDAIHNRQLGTIAAGLAGRQRISRPTSQCLDPSRTGRVVHDVRPVADPPPQHVISIVSIQGVAGSLAVERVVTGIAVELVRATAAQQCVVVAAAPQDVVAATSVDVVGSSQSTPAVRTGPTLEYIRRAAAPHRVVTRSSQQSVAGRTGAHQWTEIHLRDEQFVLAGGGSHVRIVIGTNSSHAIGGRCVGCQVQRPVNDHVAPIENLDPILSRSSAQPDLSRERAHGVHVGGHPAHRCVGQCRLSYGRTSRISVDFVN